MKIVEKKCPNCGANLDFEVGERNVQCGSCRRKFAIIYDQEKDFDHLKTSDIALKASRRGILIILAIFIIIASAGIITAIISHQRWIDNKQKSEDEFNRTVEEHKQQFEEESERMRQQFEDKYNF